MSESNKTRLRILTPNGVFYDNDVYIVTLKTSNGYIGLQVNRVPFISNIEISTIYIKENINNKKNDENLCGAIGGGIVFAEKKYIDIFTDDIEWKTHIDKSEIEKLIKKTMEELQKEKDNNSIKDNKNELILKKELVLKKAINKLSTLSK